MWWISIILSSLVTSAAVVSTGLVATYKKECKAVYPGISRCKLSNERILPNMASSSITAIGESSEASVLWTTKTWATQEKTYHWSPVYETPAIAKPKAKRKSNEIDDAGRGRRDKRGRRNRGPWRGHHSGYESDDEDDEDSDSEDSDSETENLTLGELCKTSRVSLLVNKVRQDLVNFSPLTEEIVVTYLRKKGDDKATTPVYAVATFAHGGQSRPVRVLPGEIVSFKQTIYAQRDLLAFDPTQIKAGVELFRAGFLWPLKDKIKNHMIFAHTVSCPDFFDPPPSPPFQRP